MGVDRRSVTVIEPYDLSPGARHPTKHLRAAFTTLR
jgi:hypothetical protein